MRRTVAGLWDVPSEGVTPALVAVSACFFAGSVAGCLLCANVAGGGGDSLSVYLRAFLAAAGTGDVGSVPLFPLLWEVLRWPLLAVLLGFTALGLLFIPVLFAIRGFLLSFAVSSFVRMFGGAGGVLAFLVFGIPELAAIPALFVLGVQGLQASRALAGRAMGEGRRGSPFGKAYFLRCGVCAGAFCVCVLLEYLAVPALVAAAASLVPA